MKTKFTGLHLWKVQTFVGNAAYLIITPTSRVAQSSSKAKRVLAVNRWKGDRKILSIEYLGTIDA